MSSVRITRCADALLRLSLARAKGPFHLSAIFSLFTSQWQEDKVLPCCRVNGLSSSEWPLSHLQVVFA